MGLATAPPTPIDEGHKLSEFNSGNRILDDWLRRKALYNERNNASRTFVTCSDEHVIGYYSLAVGSVDRPSAISRVRRNMPDPIPVMVLARLAVDLSWQGHGIGSDLLRDAILRTINVSEMAGIKAIIVHAIDQQAAKFYQERGFKESPILELMLMISVQEARQALDNAKLADLKKTA